MDLVTKFVDGDKTAINKILLGGLWPAYKKEIKKQMDIKYKPKKYYYYLITFTLKENHKDYTLIENYILGQVERKALHIVEAHYTKELTKKGRPHWHVAVKSEKCIPKNRFNYYEKKYGKIDISKSVTNTIDESINYINKENQSITLIPRVL